VFFGHKYALITPHNRHICAAIGPKWENPKLSEERDQQAQALFGKNAIGALIIFDIHRLGKNYKGKICKAGPERRSRNLSAVDFFEELIYLMIQESPHLTRWPGNEGLTPRKPMTQKPLRRKTEGWDNRFLAKTEFRDAR
jgi:hypothetical protein